jgi:crossover junction endodeoxyribonuclease RuvC
MIILGLDPGSRRAGYGVIRMDGRRFHYIASGVLDYSKEEDFIARLGLLHHAVDDLISQFSPDEIALEALVFVKNVNSLAKLSQARGAMIASALPKYQGKIFEYSPTLVKSAVSGHGQSSKEGVDKALKMIFSRTEDFATHDESDALAIALSHALLRGKEVEVKVDKHKKSGRGLAASVQHAMRRQENN